MQFIFKSIVEFISARGVYTNLNEIKFSSFSSFSFKNISVKLLLFPESFKYL